MRPAIYRASASRPFAAASTVEAPPASDSIDPAPGLPAVAGSRFTHHGCDAGFALVRNLLRSAPHAARQAGCCGHLCAVPNAGAQLNDRRPTPQGGATAA